MNQTSNIRLIPRLDVKAPNLIKGVRLEGLRVIGDPQEFALRYYQEGADELIYMDVVASLYGRNHLARLIKDAAKNIFVPITVGGGVRSLADVRELLCSGADKVAINTGVIANPKLITQVAETFGSQCMVVSVEAKQSDHLRWEVLTENGRERTGKDVVTWVKEAVERGAGEVLLTSVDQEGTRKGFDINLIRSVTEAVSVPVIASGGMGNSADGVEVVREGGADAIAMADILHYERASIGEIRLVCLASGLNVRAYDH